MQHYWATSWELFEEVWDASDNPCAHNVYWWFLFLFVWRKGRTQFHCFSVSLLYWGNSSCPFSLSISLLASATGWEENLLQGRKMPLPNLPSWWLGWGRWWSLGQAPNEASQKAYALSWCCSFTPRNMPCLGALPKPLGCWGGWEDTGEQKRDNQSTIQPLLTSNLRF